MADEILGGALSDRQTMSEAVARPESERSDLLELPDAVRDQLIEGSAPVNESLKGFVKGVKNNFNLNQILFPWIRMQRTVLH